MKNRSKNKQPGLPGLILSRLLSEDERLEKLGDFEEGFRLKIRRIGLAHAQIWYWFQVFRMIPVYLKNTAYRSSGMLKNFLKIALRNLTKHKLYSFINISGLAVGIASFLLISQYVIHELSYDSFHEKADRVYRIAQELKSPQSSTFTAISAPALGKTLTDEFPEVTDFTRMSFISTTGRWTGATSVLISYEDRMFNEGGLVFADSGFFDVFSLPLAKGDPKTALARPKSIVLTKNTAEKYFNAEDPMGKVLTIENHGDYTVTGISENLPNNSHFSFDFLASLEMSSTSWVGVSIYTYIVLDENADVHQVEEKFPDFIKAHVGPEVEARRGVSYSEYLSSGNGYKYIMQPLTDIHLTSDFDYEIEQNGSLFHVYMFAVISIITLLIACFNFMNLSTARSATRAKEVGVRKVLGSYRMQLIKQFLTESILSSFISLALALIIIQLVTPVFNELMGKQLTASYLSDWQLLLILTAFTAGLGVLAGIYPAFFLSMFRPVAVLKGSGQSRGKSRSMRNGLVVFQFSISLILIVATIVVNGQVEHMINKEIGFSKNHVVIIEKADLLGNSLETYKQEILNRRDILHAAGSNTVPGKSFGLLTFTTKDGNVGDRVPMKIMFADNDFLKTLNIKLLEGRSFDEKFRSDSLGVILNQAAVEKFGWEDPVGRQIMNYDGDLYTVVGVTDEFHFESLHSGVRPLAIFREDAAMGWGNVQLLSVRMNSTNISETLQYLENKWNEIIPDKPFMYTFFDKDFDALYSSDLLTKRIFGIFASLALLIACLGLFGLAAFLAEQRTKEVGIRKVLGADVRSIILLHSQQFMKLVLVAFAVASPVAYYVMQNWLQKFAYRIDISLWTFFVAGMTMLGITLLTISYNAIKSALSNPVYTLRNE